ncbi:MAG: Fic family protein [Verrucomicrobia bacterium]|nr:Fic family protein [Verrucomicrobiota bacterium]
MKRAWLQPFTWAVIVETNRQLCLPKGALHKATSDGYEPTRQLWESLHRTEMPLAEATNLCRRCHQLAPFCNFNGNTFVAVIRKVISTLTLPPVQAAALRSLAGHIVAGIATPEEQRAFEKAMEAISALDDCAEAVHGSGNELAEQHRPLAETTAAGQSPPPLGDHSRTGGAEHGLRGRASESADPPRDTRPDRATRFVETTRGVLSYGQLAPLLAERVVAVQADIEGGVYTQRPFEESLLLEFHRRVAGDLVPDWAGRWRAIEVRVGNLQPPPPHAVPLRMRDYCLDLQARWPEAAVSIGDLTLEFLASAEGRFLTVHPFQDFNGRVIRLFLSELLRRLDLPPARLEAEGETERAAYFAALQAADQNDLRPLIEIWKQRLAAPEPPTA